MNNDSKLLEARKLKDSLQWNDAAKLYCEIAKYNDSPIILQETAWCLSRNEQYEKAIEYLSILCEKEPNMAKWYYMKGYQYYCLKQWNSAVEWFEKALSKKKDYFVVKYRLAYAYLQITGNHKQWTKAEFWRSLGHLRECHDIWNSYNNDKRNKEKNTYFDVNFLLGKTLLKLPEFIDESIGCLKRALEIKEDDDCSYNLAKAYFNKKEYISAKNCLPKNNKYYVVEYKAFILAKLGKHEEAIELIKNLLLKRKKDYLYRILAEMYILSSDLYMAYKMAIKAISLNKKNHKSYCTLSKIYYRFGLLNTALENLEVAIRLKQENFNVEYLECIKLKSEISKKVQPNYKEDVELIETLNSRVKEKNNSNCTLNGIISKYDDAKKFGFIKSGSASIFFHISDCKSGNVHVGDRVSFKEVMTEKGKKAINILKK